MPEYTYEVRVRRSTDGWLVAIPALGAVVRARDESDVAVVAREYIAAARGVSAEDVAVTIRESNPGELDLPGL